MEEKSNNKLNCWEYKKCGRQTCGPHESEACPVTAAKRLDGVHGGENAGRACWVVDETFCDGELQGTFSKKYDRCMECDFYKKVKDEEASLFQLSATLFLKLH